MYSLALLSLLFGLSQAQNISKISATPVRIPSEWTYLLPHPFNSTMVYSWLNSTTAGDANITNTLRQASKSRFVSYSDEFDQLVGKMGVDKISTINCPADAPKCAYEAGVWIPDTNEVWFAYLDFVYPYTQALTTFSLNNATSRQIKTNPPINYPLGGYYWNGKAYFTEYSIPTNPASIIAIDPKTYKVDPIVNSYFGMPLAPADDMVVTSVKGKEYIFFTTLSMRNIIGDKFPQQMYDTAVWRFDTQKKLLTPVISNTDIIAPNGIRVSPDGRTMYITNTAFISPETWNQQADKVTQSNSIYVYDLNDDAVPVNRRLFGLERTGFSNGECLR